MQDVTYDESGNPFAAVCFTQPLTGKQIAGLTQLVAGENGRGRYIEELNPYDEQDIRCGQISGFPYQQTRVIPSRRLLEFRLADTYKGVMVTSHAWRAGGFSVGFGPDDIVEAVEGFAAELIIAAEEAISINVFPDYVRSPGNLNNW
jgi:hypothetical protein